MKPADCLWLQSLPGSGYAEFPHWKLLEKLIEWGYAQEDPDGEDWDDPQGFSFLGDKVVQLKWLQVPTGGKTMAGAYVARPSGPSFFLEPFRGCTEAELGRAAGELFRVSRVLTATQHMIRGVRWALNVTGWDDGELGVWLKRLRAKRKRTQRPLKKALSAEELMAREPLPEGWSEPKKGWTIELKGLPDSVLEELGPRLHVGDFGW